MIKFSKDKVLLLHRLIAQETGGSIGLRDEALLDSALENAFAGFGGQEFYPTKEEKGARLGYTLISNHAFVDGNGHYRLNQPQDERSALMSASSLRIPLSHQQIPRPGTEHRERGIFDPSAEFFMFPLDTPFVLMYYCRSTSELMGGAARMSRCDCSDPSAAQAKEDAYGMGYPQ